MHPRLQSHRHLANETAWRLRRAVAACGYSNEAGAAAYVGEEFMAILRRLTHGWAAICAKPDIASLNAVAHRLSHHLWAVKTDGLAPLAGQDRVRAAREAAAASGHRGGRDLMLTLARALDNDANLVPLVEARDLSMDLGEAEKIAKEAYRQWTCDRLTPKALFRRALSRRLRACGRSF